MIAVGENPTKTSPVFSVEERLQFLRIITANLSNVEVVIFSGLLVDFAKSCEIDVIIRAIRTIFDFESETLQAQMNPQLGALETFYHAVHENYRLISSSLVREIGFHGKRLIDFIPLEIEETVFNRLYTETTSRFNIYRS